MPRLLPNLGDCLPKLGVIDVAKALSGMGFLMASHAVLQRYPTGKSSMVAKRTLPGLGASGKVPSAMILAERIGALPCQVWRCIRSARLNDAPPWGAGAGGGARMSG